MPADYIMSLRQQYVTNVVNGMIVAVLRGNQDVFTRCRALLALLSLSEIKKEAGKGFTLQRIFKQAVKAIQGLKQVFEQDCRPSMPRD